MKAKSTNTASLAKRVELINLTPILFDQNVMTNPGGTHVLI